MGLQILDQAGRVNAVFPTSGQPSNFVLEEKI
jgi:hypothetical protein